MSVVYDDISFTRSGSSASTGALREWTGQNVRLSDVKYDTVTLFESDLELNTENE